MIRSRLSPLAALAVLVFAPVSSSASSASTAFARRATPDPVLERILALGKADNRAHEHLRTLCKTIGPRLTGTEAYDRAARWAVEELRAYGLEARLEVWGELPSRFERGDSSGGMVEPDTIDYTFATSAWSPGTAGPKRGPALLEPTTEAGLEAAKARLAGAWIVSADPPPKDALRRELREAAIAAGAHGFVRPGPRNGRLLMGGDPRTGAPDRPAPAVAIQLLRAQHDDLRQRLEREEPVVLEFDVRNVLAPGPVPCANVVADLVGRERPDEIVIVGAHLDSWDGAEGAQDDAAGCATAIEAARLVAAAGGRPRRTIRIVLFGGEEQGLLGSKGYVETHVDELSRTSLAMIHDAGSTALVGLDATYAILADFRAVFAPVADLDPRWPFRVGESDGLVNTGDSDHAPFLSAGVPGFFWKQGEEGYPRVHHTQFDRLETVDPEQQAHSSVVVAVAAWGFAELDHLLDRTDAEEVPPRRLGVGLEGTRVTRVSARGKAGEAGWEAGDVVLSVDGVEVSDRDAITELVRAGGARKVFRLRRGEETLETALDWSGEEAEPLRLERAARREAWLRSRSAPEGPGSTGARRAPAGTGGS